MLLLANTRPYEGLLMVVPLVAVLLWAWGRRRTSSLTRAMVVSVVVLMAGAALMLRYDRQVTGSTWKMPYQLYESRHNPAPTFVGQRLREIPPSQSGVQAAVASSALSELRYFQRRRTAFIASKLFCCWQFAFGATGSLLFLLLCWRKAGWLERLLYGAAVLTVQGIAVQTRLFWPRPEQVVIVPLFAGIAVQVGMLWRWLTYRTERWALALWGVTTLGILAENWNFRTHYVAPAVPLAVLLLASAGQRLWAWERMRWVIAATPLILLGVAWAGATEKPTTLQSWARHRAQLERRLASEPGRQLVLVRNAPGHDYYEMWVANAADPEAAAVVWASSGDAETDCRLQRAYPGRTAWNLDSESGALTRAGDACLAPKKEDRQQAPPLQFESLPPSRD
jgi:hypothetical protein